MDEAIQMFMAVTDVSDVSIANQYLEFANNDVDYAINLFLESGGTTHSTNNNMNSDEQLAQNMQNDLYADNEPRAPDQARHETLMDTFQGGYNPGMVARPALPTDIFGTGPRSAFNQRFDMDDEIDDDDDDEDYVMELDSDGEIVERRQTTAPRLTSSQRRLANIFRPPFDIMEILDLDSAKRKGRSEKKWILVNIQDSSDFQCQVLNRDFWSNAQVREIIAENFIFLQYQNDSPNGINYSQFYSFDTYPHIAILDPMTGERLKFWSETPVIKDWLEEVVAFLGSFSLNPNHINPIVKHEVKIDPDKLTEDQQIELALKQSLGSSTEGTASAPMVIDSDDEIEEVGEPEEPKELTDDDIFNNIVAQDHEEPTDNATSTRIQIRFSDGKRLIHKFGLSEKVIVIFQFLKNHLLKEEISSPFTLTSQRLNLISQLDNTIQESGLKNASILCEIN